MNKSVALPKVEIVDLSPLDYSPLISKCTIKVCWVDDEKINRNGSLLSKETGYNLARTIRGAAIVGHYIDEKGDFSGHDEAIEFVGDKIVFKDLTQPYGFVDLSAKVWFQFFLDSDGVEREYLCTEGFLWTNIYPECKRVLDRGNNQSMELNQETLKGHWAENDNSISEFFIINEAIAEKLCILGEDVEPCFEGSQITKVQFSLSDEFNTKFSEMVNTMKEFLKKGGNPMEEETVLVEEVPAEENPIEEEAVETPVEEEASEEEAPAEEIEEEDSSEETPVEEEIPAEDPAEEEPAPAQYVLEDIPEYIELSNRFESLNQEVETLRSENANLQAQIDSLTEFKASVEKGQKEELINSFYMLSDEDKAEVVKNIDTYSLKDIKAELSMLCVDKKVSFSKDNEETAPMTFNINSQIENNDVDNAPDWLKAVEAHNNNKNY